MKIPMKKTIFHEFFYDQEPRNILPFVFMSLFIHGLLIAAVLGGILPVFDGGEGNRSSGIPDINLVSEIQRESSGSRPTVQPDGRRAAGAGRRSARKKEGPALEPEGKSSLQGRILNKARVPVAGANVAVINLKTRQTMTTISDSSGAYSLQQIDSGEYEIRIRTVQLDRPLQRTVNIGRGMRLTLNIQEPNPAGETLIAAGSGRDGSTRAHREVPAPQQIGKSANVDQPQSLIRNPGQDRAAGPLSSENPGNPSAQTGDFMSGSLFRSLTAWSFKRTDPPPSVTDIILDNATMILIRRFLAVCQALTETLRRCRSLNTVWY